MNMHLQTTLTKYIIRGIVVVTIILALFSISTGLFAQVINDTIEFEGRTREYALFLPTDYEKLDSLPLVLNLHGSYVGESGPRQMSASGMNMVADTAGFMVVYPTGINRDGIPGFWYTGLVDPVNGMEFINVLLDTLVHLYKVDEDRIYSCGFSSGGNMSCNLAYSIPHRIAAIANVAGAIDGDVMRSLELEKPMPFLSVHGTADNYSSAMINVAFWKDLNICSNPDTVANENHAIEKITYVNENCKVVHFRVLNGAHNWLTNKYINTSVEIWKFFKQYKLSELSFPNHDVTPRLLMSDLKTLPKYMNLQPVAQVQNGGLNEESTIPAVFQIDSSGTIVYESSQTLDELMSMEKKDLLFDRTHTLIADQYDVICTTLLANDENAANDTLKQRMVITNTIDNFDSGDDTQWISDYGWGIRRSANDAVSGDCVLYSKKDRSYKNADTTTATFFSSFNLSSLETAYLSFNSKYDFFEGDIGCIEISIDNGLNWEQVGESFTGSQSEHKLTEVSLESYIKSDLTELMIRFKVVNSPDNDFPKWYIDDVVLHPNEVSGIVVKSEPSYIQTDHFALSKNYPNPFNHSTIIQYSLFERQHLTLKIMNILGQEVATLVDTQQSPGEYTVSWNGQDRFGNEVNSSVYFYRIQTPNKIVTHKMLLAK